MTTRTLAVAAFTVLTVPAMFAQAPPRATPAPTPAAQGQPGPPQAALPPLSCSELAAALRTAMTNDIRSRDWAALNRYRESNRTNPKADVVFMGDSITDSWQRQAAGFFPGKNYADRGISGQTTPQMLVRFRSDVINLKPRAVVILAGTNDIAGNTGPMTNEEIQGNLQSMAELAAANGIKVVFSSITPVSEYHMTSPNATPQTIQRPMARIRAINDWMKTLRLCQQAHVSGLLLGHDRRQGPAADRAER